MNTTLIIALSIIAYLGCAVACGTMLHRKEEPMPYTLKQIRNATLGTLEDQPPALREASNEKLAAAINELGTDIAMEGYMLIREALCRDDDDLFQDHPQHGTKVRIAE